MKKIFIVLAVMAALMFSVAPSQALNSMPDDVPGLNPLLPFFLVDKANLRVGGVGLDTLFVIQEVGGQVGTVKHGITKGALHWVVRNYKSAEIVNDTIGYTPDDVIAISVKDILATYLSDPELTGLEISLNGKTYYTGYMDFENSWYVDGDRTGSANNLVAFMYVIDLPNGWAASTTAPVYEDATAALGFDARQRFSKSTDYGTYYLEPFNGPAYAVSDLREKGQSLPSGTTVDSFRLLPRYYLKDCNAQTWIPIWSSDNKVTSTFAYSFPLTIYVYDNDEDVMSKTINIPYELNWFDIRTVLPACGTGGWGDVKGGWIDMNMARTTATWASGLDNTQWLAYSYQTASSASASASWSVLTAVHREVGTLCSGS